MVRGPQRYGDQCSCIGCIGLRPALVALLIKGTYIFILCEKKYEQICSSASTNSKNPLLAWDCDQHARVNTLIKRLLCKLLFTQCKHTWLVRIRLCSRPIARISQQGVTKITRGAHFLNTVLDVCSNRGAKHETGAQILTSPPLATALLMQICRNTSLS